MTPCPAKRRFSAGCPRVVMDFGSNTCAREAQADRFANEIIEIADDTSGDWVERDGVVVADHEHIQRSKLRVDTRKWLMARMVPKKYGDKIVLAGDGETPLQLVTQINLVPVAPRRRK